MVPSGPTGMCTLPEGEGSPGEANWAGWVVGNTGAFFLKKWMEYPFLLRTTSQNQRIVFFLWYILFKILKIITAMAPSEAKTMKATPKANLTAIAIITQMSVAM